MYNNNIHTPKINIGIFCSTVLIEKIRYCFHMILIKLRCILK